MTSVAQNCASMAFEERFPSDEIPAIIRAELNADVDREVLARMRHLAWKKRIAQPEITDEEMADYLALAENCANFTQWLSVRRGKGEPRLRTGAAWAVAALAVLGVLTAMLIIAIAVAV